MELVVYALHRAQMPATRWFSLALTWAYLGETLWL